MTLFDHYATVERHRASCKRLREAGDTQGLHRARNRFTRALHALVAAELEGVKD